MGIFDDLYRSFQAQERVPGISPDFQTSQATPNVYTPPAYPTFPGYPTIQNRQQVPFSPYPAPPTGINMDSIIDYGRQISGQRPPTPYAPVATPTTDKLAQDTANKLVGAKYNRALNVLDYVKAGEKVGLPALQEAKQTFTALNDYYNDSGGGGESSDGSANTGPGSAGVGGSLGLGLMGMAESVPSISTAIVGLIGEAMVDAAIDANTEADNAIADATTMGQTTTASIGLFGPAVSTIGEAESEADTDSIGDTASNAAS